MLLKVLKSKIQRATVTDADLHYEGSLSVDSLLIEAADMIPHESVHVWNVNNGTRLETYVIPAAAGSGTICLNGAAARMGQPGDLIIIATFAWMEDSAARGHEPRVVLVDARNRIRGAAGESGDGALQGSGRGAEAERLTKVGERATPGL
jgi:aspartate 1-decarboxylase